MEPVVTSATPRAIIDFLAHQNIPVPRELRKPRYTIRDAVMVWEYAERVTGDVAIGRRVAESVPFGAFGIAECIALFSPTLDLSVRRLVRYFPLIHCAFDASFDCSLRRARFELWPRGEASIHASYGEFVLTVIRSRLARVLGQPFAHELRMGESPALTFDRALLGRAAANGDEELCEAFEDVARRRVSEGRRSVAALVRDAIRRDFTADAAAVAAMLGMTVRTLQRRLVAEGDSFRAAMDDARRERALALMRAGEGTKRIADRTGFAEVRSFYRAFHRWTGFSPEAYRCR
jgi:AraC-like DNA-binding protein